MDQASLSPDTMKSIRFLEGIRKDVLSRIGGLSESQAMAVPEGCRNSVHWNVGHVLHVQLAHWYVRRGQPLPVDLGWKAYFREGKSPADYDAGTPSFSALLDVYGRYSFDLARTFGPMLEEPLTVPFGYLGARFESVDDDLRLLLFHEGEHYVIVKRILKALAGGTSGPSLPVRTG